MPTTEIPNSVLGGTRIHGSFGTGIRPPDGFELAFTNNPHLKPEKSVSFDAGIEQSCFSNLAVVDFTYFFNRFEDQIVTLGGSVQNLSSYTSDNLKNSRAQGLGSISPSCTRFNPWNSPASTHFVDTAILALDGSSDG